MDHDYESLLWDESGDLASLLDNLDDADFDIDSLCAGWRVRDVVSHMLIGHTTPFFPLLGSMAKYRFNIPKASAEMSHAFGSAHTPDQIRSAWANVVSHKTLEGIARMIPKKEGFTDHLIHTQDIRRPLGRPRTISDERLTAALDALPSIGGFLKSKQRMKGLSWIATDVEWQWGEGPEVTGPAEAMIMAASGRSVALDDLSGEGMATLSGRVKTAEA